MTQGPRWRQAHPTAAHPLWTIVKRRTYNTYMPNKTISVPDDVVPIIDNLDLPFSKWVTQQLRRHAAQSTMSFAQQLVADAALVTSERKLKRADALTTGQRMERSAPW